MEADVSQCELRVLAHFSQDPRLLAAFRDGNVDLHVQTAAAALGIAAEQVTDEQRGIGKQVNFAIVYGMAADSLAQKLAIIAWRGAGVAGWLFRRLSWCASLDCPGPCGRIRRSPGTHAQRSSPPAS